MVSCRPGRCAASSLRDTSSLPSSTSSSAEKKVCGGVPRSRVKNSASDIGTPSSTFLSELTEGLTRFCSISEINPFVTPARRASSRCERPNVVRMPRNRAPTSMLMPAVRLDRAPEPPADSRSLPPLFNILNKKGQMSVWMASFVNFPYHPGLSPPTVRARYVPDRTRSLLDAVHREPAIQVKAPLVEQGLGHALLDARWPADPRRRCGPLVCERWTRPPRNYRGRFQPIGNNGLRAAFPDGTPGRVRAGKPAREDHAARPGPCVLHKLRLGVRGHRTQDCPCVPPCPR